MTEVLVAAGCLVWFFAASLWTVNALRAPVPPGEGPAPLWLPAMLVSELAPVFFVARALVAWAFWALGAADNPVGVAGLVLFAGSEVGLLALMARSVRSARATGHSPGWWTLPKVYERPPDGVEIQHDVEYAPGLTADVMARPGLTGAPALIYLHPGSWMRGRPGRQARPLMHRLAATGWVVLDARYPLSPTATFPDHVVGVKRMIAWAKNLGDQYGIDPGRVAIAGASSGAHLAALAALTPDRQDWQPGFEQTDTSVAACLPFYGIFDLLVRRPTRHDWPFVSKLVMKVRPNERADLYRSASPVDQARPDAPPFFVLHGSHDSVVLPAESRHFVAAMESAGARVRYHEVGWAQHGFDAVSSLRSRAVGELCAMWLSEVMDRRSRQRRL